MTKSNYFNFLKKNVSVDLHGTLNNGRYEDASLGLTLSDNDSYGLIVRSSFFQGERGPHGLSVKMLVNPFALVERAKTTFRSNISHPIDTQNTQKLLNHSRFSFLALPQKNVEFWPGCSCAIIPLFKGVLYTVVLISAVKVIYNHNPRLFSTKSGYNSYCGVMEPVVDQENPYFQQEFHWTPGKNCYLYYTPTYFLDTTNFLERCVLKTTPNFKDQDFYQKELTLYLAFQDFKHYNKQVDFVCQILITGLSSLTWYPLTRIFTLELANQLISMKYANTFLVQGFVFVWALASAQITIHLIGLVFAIVLAFVIRLFRIIQHRLIR